MKSERAMPEPRSRYWAAVGIAVALLLASGAGYWWQAARYAQAYNNVSIPPGTLAVLPMCIGQWVGEDVPLKEQIIQKTNTDDHVNRRYSRGGEMVSFWLAYGVRSRDLMPHRPEVCYPGAGWTLDGTQLMELKDNGGSIVPCQVHRFHRGVLQTERIVVLSYYLVDGQYSPDVSLVRRRSVPLKSSLKYIAQIQAACPYIPLRDLDKQPACLFVADSAEEIRMLLEETVHAAGSLTDAGAG